MRVLQNHPGVRISSTVHGKHQGEELRCALPVAEEASTWIIKDVRWRFKKLQMLLYVCRLSTLQKNEPGYPATTVVCESCLKNWWTALQAALWIQCLEICLSEPLGSRSGTETIVAISSSAETSWKGSVIQKIPCLLLHEQHLN